jgi:antitoxin VapB
MALNIKDKETEALVNEIASLTGETKTGAVRQAARERLERLRPRTGGGKNSEGESLRQFLEREIWPLVPPELLGRGISKAEREEILGYGPEGY